MAEIDFSPYARAPRLETNGGLALAIKLIRAAPTGLSRGSREALEHVRATALELQTEAKARKRLKPTSLRVYDTPFDRGWTALRDRIAAWLGVEDPQFRAQRQRAERLMAAYFPEGVMFVQLAFEEEWIESQQLLERIKEEKAYADFVELAGKPFVANVETHHRALGVALGLVEGESSADAGSSAALGVLVNKLGRAILGYTRRLIGEVNEDDPESVARFQSAVEPLDAYRTRWSASGGAPAAEVPPEPAPSEPVPELPSS